MAGPWLVPHHCWLLLCSHDRKPQQGDQSGLRAVTDLSRTFLLSTFYTGRRGSGQTLQVWHRAMPGTMPGTVC